MNDLAKDLTKNVDPQEKRATLKRAVEIINKMIRYSKGGLNSDERQDLAADLLDFASLLLRDAID
jgi:flagellin-specific chaperone FliS